MLSTDRLNTPLAARGNSRKPPALGWTLFSLFLSSSFFLASGLARWSSPHMRLRSSVFFFLCEARPNRGI